MLLNKAQTKSLVLARARALRPSRSFSHVSAEVYVYLEGKLRTAVDDMIQRHPSCGVMIFPLIRQNGGNHDPE